MLDWIKDHPAIAWSLLGLSVAVFVASLAVVPALVVRIPADYFTHARRPRGALDNHSPPMRLLLRIGKNLLGLLLVLAGIAMLALPGQGLLTLIIGILLLDGPGKYQFERWLVRRSWVHRPINWLRRRRGRAPLDLNRKVAGENLSGTGELPVPH